jgi:AbrB family looped-hinge helix DNA binding protein
LLLKGAIQLKEVLNLRAAGIVGKIDSVGSVVIPKEMMKSLGINNGDLIEFLLLTEEDVIIRKHKPYIKVLEDIHLTEDEIREKNAYNLNKIDETIRLHNNVKKLYKAYLGMD